jgi:uncharacterized protein (DUF58 family)
MDALFSKEFVAAVSQMRLNAGTVLRGGRQAEHVSTQLGSGMEFSDYRLYAPGDDIRRIDWNLYSRSGRLFLRLFEEERDLPVYTLLDCSDSMFFEDPPRANAAKQAAAILIGAALNQQDRPSLYPYGETLLEGFPSISHQRALPATLERLAAIGPCGPTNLPAVLHRFKALRLRRGVVVVISDFFDPAGIDALLESLSGLPHKLLLIQLCDDRDAQPNISGELSLVDCETGHDLRVTVTPRLVEEYQRIYAAFQHKLLAFSTKRMAGYLTINVRRNVLEQFLELFSNGVITTGG